MRWLASTVASLGGIAFFGYVKPKPGYGVALAKRHSKLDTMARMARLIHGRNKDFIPRDGISPRNEVGPSACRRLLDSHTRSRFTEVG